MQAHASDTMAPLHQETTRAAGVPPDEVSFVGTVEDQGSERLQLVHYAKCAPNALRHVWAS